MPSGYEHFIREVHAIQQSRGDSYTEAYKLAKLLYPNLYQDYAKTIDGGTAANEKAFANSESKPETGPGPATVRIAQVVAERMTKFNEDYVSAYKKVRQLRPDLFENVNS